MDDPVSMNTPEMPTHWVMVHVTSALTTNGRGYRWLLHTPIGETKQFYQTWFDELRGAVDDLEAYIRKQEGVVEQE